MSERQIKFRGWDRKNGRMVYPHFDGKEMTTVEIYPENFECPWEITYSREDSLLDTSLLSHKDGILMQYIGIQDCDKVKIYESDIVVSCPEPEQKAWFDGCGVVVFHDTSWKVLVRGSYITIFTPEHFGIGLKVIGNVYQNPELLQ